MFLKENIIFFIFHLIHITLTEYANWLCKQAEKNNSDVEKNAIEIQLLIIEE